MRNIYVTYFQVSNIDIEGGPQHTHKPPSFIGSSLGRMQSGRQSHVNLNFEEGFGFINKSLPVLVIMINFLL